jgi:hypothetical protein
MIHQQKVAKVTKGILDAFKKQFPHLEPEEDFETIWPLSAWDTIRTETRTFSVHLKLDTGKVISIEEEL